MVTSKSIAGLVGALSAAPAVSTLELPNLSSGNLMPRFPAFLQTRTPSAVCTELADKYANLTFYAGSENYTTENTRKPLHII
jgi:hypothetical protein